MAGNDVIMDIGAALNISAAPHVLISGSTGSGKSVCLNSIIYKCLLLDPASEMIFIDIKRVELNRYRKLKQCICYANTIESALKALQYCHNVMMIRYQILEKHEMRQWPAGSMYIFIDELADLVQQSKALQSVLVSIARLGRAADVHIVAACQHCTREIISTQFRYNMPTRILFRTTKNASMLLLDHGGAEKLKGRGHGIILQADGSEEEYQNIYISDDQIDSLIEKNKKEG